MINYYAAPGMKRFSFGTRTIKAEIILEAVSRYYGVPVKDILGRWRTMDIVKARHIAMYLIYKKSALSLQQIGGIFNRDHATVIHARDTIIDHLTSKADNSYKDDIQKLIEIL